MKSQDQFTIVVVGGVAGGASAAARARRCNEEARIILYEKDGYVSFANCGLPYYLGGEIEDRDKLLVTKPELFRDRFNIEVYTKHEVVDVNAAQQTVTVKNLDTNETVVQKYDRLVLAPGAAPFVPPMEGCDAANVFTLRNLEDTDRIHGWITGKNPRKAVVVGAGFIGLEMVEQLHNLGMDVALAELAPQVLPPLDPDIAAFLQETLEAHGVQVHTGAGIQGITVENGAATAVTLDNGVSLDADMVILGMGVRANLDLAKAAGLEIGATGGIKTNEYLQSSNPQIYAVGDAVEYAHALMPEPTRVPLAGPANRAGRIAGTHAASCSGDAMTPVLGTAILRVFDKVAGITGLSLKAAQKMKLDARVAVIAGGHHAGYYPGAENLVLKIVYEAQSGKLLGAQAVGGAGVDKRLDVLSTVLHFGGTVRDLAGLDLAYAPPFGSAKDPVHIAGFVACNDLDGFDMLLPPDADLSGKQVVDVRSDEEYHECHVEGAVHIPINELRNNLDRLDKNRETVVMCHIGGRAHVGTRILMQHGFTQVYNLSGGMFMRRRAHPKGVVYGKG